MQTPSIQVIRRGFTLIELLIVVAIIAILAAIAVPNFINAQTRAKVGRVKSDMRTVATALEAYAVDYNIYPFDGANWNGTRGGPYNFWHLPPELSTPVAYITTTYFPDPFRNQRQSFSQDANLRYTYVDATYGPKYTPRLKPFNSALEEANERYRANFGAWRLSSGGPDGGFGPSGWPGLQGLVTNLPYDPSNGVISDGDIIRSQINAEGGANFGT